MVGAVEDGGVLGWGKWNITVRKCKLNSTANHLVTQACEGVGNLLGFSTDAAFD